MKMLWIYNPLLFSAMPCKIALKAMFAIQSTTQNVLNWGNCFPEKCTKCYWSPALNETYLCLSAQHFEKGLIQPQCIKEMFCVGLWPINRSTNMHIGDYFFFMQVIWDMPLFSCVRICNTHVSVHLLACRSWGPARGPDVTIWSTTM